MSDYDRGVTRPATAGAADMAVDAGLRAFMLGVYNKMALGLLLSAALAYASAYVPQVRDLFFVVADGRLAGITALGRVMQFAPIVVLLVAMFAMRNPSPRAASALYWGIVSLIGVWLGVVLLIYTGSSVFTTFLITATAFGVLSLVGYTTKKDLSGFGSFLIMGLWGLIAASLVSFFVRSTALFFIINVVGVLIFAGLTAYDTQKLKMTYYAVGADGSRRNVATSFGALTLYLDFLNLFLFLLRITGGRR